MLQLIWFMPTWRTRLLLSSGTGLFAGFYCWYLMRHTHQGAGDFMSAIRAAKDLLENRNPYASPQQLYPLPAALFGLPFVRTAPEIAGGIFYGLSSALLTFGITRQGYHHLLIFLAYPYWAGMLTVQWIPLIMASAFFPWLMPVVLAKPQIGLPVATTHASLKGAAACLLVLLASFLVMPHWFPLWMGQLSGYSRFIPLFVFPGPLLVIALLRYRDRDAWLLFLAACMPQRWFYDAFFSVADSQAPATNCSYRGLQLDSGDMALVSRATQFHRSRAMDGAVLLSSDINGRSRESPARHAAKPRGTRENRF